MMTAVDTKKPPRTKSARRPEEYGSRTPYTIKGASGYVCCFQFLQVGAGPHTVVDPTMLPEFHLFAQSPQDAPVPSTSSFRNFIGGTSLAIVQATRRIAAGTGNAFPFAAAARHSCYWKYDGTTSSTGSTQSVSELKRMVIF